MALTDAEIKELSRILDKRIGKRKQRPPLRTPESERAQAAAPCNVVPIRSCHSVVNLQHWNRHYGGGEVVDITAKLPPRRGRMNQARTLRNIGELFTEFNDRHGEVGEGHKDTIRAIVEGHLQEARIKSTRERDSVDFLFQEQWNLLWNRWIRERDTRGLDE